MLHDRNQRQSLPRCGKTLHFLNSVFRVRLLVLIFAPLSRSCHLFSTLLTDSHLATLLNDSSLYTSSQLFSTRLESSHLSSLRIFLSPVELTRMQSFSTTFPFSRSGLLVQLAFVFQGTLNSVQLSVTLLYFLRSA